MLSKIGFFHFGQDHAFPIEELYCALKTKGKDAVRDSLIVLPEGFNIRSRYSSPTPPYDYNPSVLTALRCTAQEWGVLFVAGLIVDVDEGIYPPYNAAYLIDGGTHELLCYRNKGDSCSMKRGCGVYTEHEGPFDRNNFIVRDGVFIAALICMDADILKDADDERYNALKKQSEIRSNNMYSGKCGKLDVSRLL
jgi:hypothetical protein